MKFADVTSVTIPEGEVAKIAIDGVPVWEKPGVGVELLEHLQFNKDMVFDTGIVPTQNSRIELKFTRESSGAMYMYGVRISDNSATVTAYLTSSGAWRFGNTYKNFTPALDTIHTAVVDKSGITMDGTKNYYGGTVKTFTATGTLTLGSARSTSGAATAAQYIGKIYYFRMYSGGELVLDWVPCMRADGVSGFWDNVSGQFVAPI